MLTFLIVVLVIIYMGCGAMVGTTVYRLRAQKGPILRIILGVVRRSGYGGDDGAAATLAGVLWPGFLVIILSAFVSSALDEKLRKHTKPE